MRILALTLPLACSRLAAAAAAGSKAAVPVLLACSVVAVSTNGLAFTAVAEYAGSSWAGRALGIQNTGQNALAAATPPVLALAIGSAGFGASFAVVAAFPLVAAVFVPVSAERAHGLWHPLVGGQRQELHVVIGQRDLSEQRGCLLVLAASKASPSWAWMVASSSPMSCSTRSLVTFGPSASSMSLCSHCQICDREISAVAASSIRLKMATAPFPASQLARYCRPTLMSLRRPASVICPASC